MIIFDYGHTLMCEPYYHFEHGMEALFAHLTRNRDGLTPKQAGDYATELFIRAGKAAREVGFEVHAGPMQRFMYEYLGLEFSVSSEEAERILWDGSSVGAAMPNADRLLDYLNEHGIRSAVISNIGWSGAALEKRINRLLPRNKFEFIIASSEYMFRKPNPLLFELALRKAGLDAADAWYCGDSIKADVEGAASAGIFPVWYEDKTLENPWSRNGDAVPIPAHLHIHDWAELIEALEGV
jgi:putative hydrolase of the HAD superfamily